MAPPYLFRMTFPIVPLLVFVIGALVWALSKNTIVQRMGEWCFVVGLLWSVCVFSRVALHLP